MILQDKKHNIKWKWCQFNDLTASQIDAMYHLRQAVFIVEQNCPYLDADGKDHLAVHLLGYLNHEVVATLRFFPKYKDYNNHASLGRVCSALNLRGFGLGRQLMSEATRYADEHYPNQAIQIGAQSYLEKFYNDFGFETISDEYLEDDIPHILMLRPASKQAT